MNRYRRFVFLLLLFVCINQCFVQPVTGSNESHSTVGDNTHLLWKYNTNG